MRISVIAADRNNYVESVESIFARIESEVDYERLNFRSVRIGPVIFFWISSAKDLLTQKGHYYLTARHAEHPEWWTISEILQGEKFKKWEPKK